MTLDAQSIALEVAEHCSGGYRALLYIGTEHYSLWYGALLPMVQSTAFTEKTDGEEPPKGPYTCEALRRCMRSVREKVYYTF